MVAEEQLVVLIEHVESEKGKMCTMQNPKSLKVLVGMQTDKSGNRT